MTSFAVQIRPATYDELDAVSTLLLEAASFQRYKGGASMAWPPHLYSRDSITAAIEAKDAFAAFFGPALVGFMLLRGEDPQFWPDDELNEALYVHRLAVSRRFAGTGVSSALLNWAVEEADRRKIPMVKLDCAPLPRLMAVYENAGFTRADAKLFQPKGEDFLNWRYSRLTSDSAER